MRDFCQAIIPTLNQQVDIGFRGDRRDEHHIVKGCDQQAPVGQEQVGVVHQLPVEMILRLGAVFRQGRHELQLAASAAAGHAPRDVVPFQDCIEAVGETLLPGKHLLESFLGGDLGQGFAHGGDGKGIAGQGGQLPW